MHKTLIQVFPQNQVTPNSLPPPPAKIFYTPAYMFETQVSVYKHEIYIYRSLTTDCILVMWSWINKNYVYTDYTATFICSFLQYLNIY